MAVTGHPRHLQIRHGTAAEWTSANPVLYLGEFGFETDSNQVKLGDGTSAWVDLAYLTTSGGSIAGSSYIGAAMLYADSDETEDFLLHGNLDKGTVAKIHDSPPSATYTGSLITTPLRELVLEATGDTHGPARLRMQSRDGLTGAMFQTTVHDVVDFVFAGPSSTGRFRFEGRDAYEKTGTAGEFQIGTTGAGAVNDAPLYVGQQGRVLIQSTTASIVPLTVRALTSQTGDLTQWVDENNVVLRRIDAKGRMYPQEPQPAFAFIESPEEPELWLPPSLGSDAHDQPLRDFIFYSRSTSPNVASGVYKYDGGAFTDGNDFTDTLEFYVIAWNGPGVVTASTRDHGARLGTTSLSSSYWGGTLPAGSYFYLPAGTYHFLIAAQLAAATTIPPDTYLYAYMDFAESTPVHMAWDEDKIAPMDMQTNPRVMRHSGGFTLHSADVIVPTFVTDSTGFGPVRILQFHCQRVA